MTDTFTETATVSDEPFGAPQTSLDLADAELSFNREVSWVAFNDRVLQLAEDPSEPLLERLKFAAIYTSNLDEFFMKIGRAHV